MHVSLYRVPTVPRPTLCYSLLKQIQKSRPLNSCGQPKYECASEPNLWEVLVSAYSHGLSSDTYNECVYNFSRALAAISQIHLCAYTLLPMFAGSAAASSYPSVPKKSFTCESPWEPPGTCPRAQVKNK